MTENNSTTDHASTQACGDCVSRRSFLGAAALGAAAMMVAACGDGNFGGTPAPPFVAPLDAKPISVAAFPGLKTVGMPVIVDTDVALVRTGPETFAAFSRKCTHYGTSVNVEGTALRCPNHGALFAADGTVVQGPAVKPLVPRAVVFDSRSGTVYVS
jgi:Rieske Fe-S protein